MTARLAVRRAQLRALAAAAREEGCIAEIEHGGVTYRLTPEALARDDPKAAAAAGHPRGVDSAREFELD